MNEKWKKIEDFEGYEVSNLGNVRSVDRAKVYKNGAVHKYKGVFLSKYITRNGYSCVQLGHAKKSLVHRLVLKAFIPNPDYKTCCNHKDGNKLNNKVSNLEWCTYAENNQHAVDIGLAKGRKGVEHHNARLNDKKVRVIKHINIIPNHINKYLVAKIFNVSWGAIHDIWNERTWKHVLV